MTPLGAAADTAPVFIHGNGTATAHDRGIAHDLAYDDAKRNAEKYCDGVTGGAVETKAAYQRLEATDEWRADVSIRETCIGRLVIP